MSNRRMFSNRIANSARFLQMPIESQLLYFHLCLRADDDGIVEAYPVIQLLGTNPDSFKLLMARGFAQQLNEDQVVVIIDWLEHNSIRPDRKVDSIYKHLLPKEIKTIKPKPRSDVEDNSQRIGGPSTDSISKVKLSKVKIKKDSITETSSVEVVAIIDEFKKWTPVAKRWYSNKTQREACKDLIEAYGFDQVMRVIPLLPKTNKKPFLPTATTPLQLFEKYTALQAGLERLKNESEKLQSKTGFIL